MNRRNFLKMINRRKRGLVGWFCLTVKQSCCETALCMSPNKTYGRTDGCTVLLSLAEAVTHVEENGAC